MTAKKVKFIRLMEGFYRDESGTFVIARNFTSLEQDRPRWVVRFDNFFGERVSRYYRTLAEAKRAIITGTIE